MGQSRFIVGIDLGTTNSALAYVDLADAVSAPPLHVFNVPQLVGVSRIEERPWLPSYLYLPGAHDLPAGAAALPWEAHRDYIVGEFAREQGLRVPARLVSSAKSWLCHGGVERESGILPWGSPSEITHLSPVEVSSRYLRHLREAWNQRMSQGRSEWRLEASEVVLTVPASFDEVARELTVKAARQAGLEKFTLLEEPQAAFYSWVRHQGDSWKDQLREGQQVLVCDVGGGTTDFTLIAVRREQEELILERIAVGDHLLLGGDNMDLALARHVERRLVKRSGELDAQQWGALVHECRRAKELLLSGGNEDRYSIVLAGRSSKVIGGSVRIDLFRDEVSELVLDGFFPRTSFDQQPQRGRSGLQELGLPYASDPAITRNLAAFLQRHQARPKAVLFNGGAMKAEAAQARVVETMKGWFGDAPQVLESTSLDLAVAIGAASYGLVRAGIGVRIRGGTVRAYYVGVQAEAKHQKKRGVCLIPFGVSEGEEVSIQEQTYAVLTGRPVSFPLYCSTAPLGHDAGQIVDITDDVFLELPPVFTVLNYERDATSSNVEVKIGARLTELGTLKFWCDSQVSKHRWDLEFSLRAGTREESLAGMMTQQTSAPVLPQGDASLKIDEKKQLEIENAIRNVFVASRTTRELSEQAKQLIKNLELLVGAERLKWPGPFIRTLWPSLQQVAQNRGLSADHEAVWLNLAGLLLRPGFGDPLDGGRIEQIWPLFREGLIHEDDQWCRVGWWILWRRVAGGLHKGQQLELTNKLVPPLMTGAAFKAAVRSSKKKEGKKGGKEKDSDGGISRQELVEMWRAAASLERIPASTKEGLADTALRQAIAGRGDFAFWALGRFGARVPLYGPATDVVRHEKVQAWLERLLGLDWTNLRPVLLTVTQLGRLCGDEERDIDEKLRLAIVEKMRLYNAPETLIGLLLNVQVLSESERGQMFGEALPAGLRLA